MDNLKDEEAVEKVCDAVDKLARSVGIPKTLKEIGIPYDALETLATQAINDVCTPGNPREVTKEDMIIASHESIKGNYHKLKEIFIKYSYALDDKEKLKYISDYCSDELKEIILNNK